MQPCHAAPTIRIVIVKILADSTLSNTLLAPCRSERKVEVHTHAMHARRLDVLSLTMRKLLMRY